MKLPDLDFELVTVAKPARAATVIGAVSSFSGPSRGHAPTDSGATAAGPALPPSSLITRAGDWAAAIHDHLETCPVCDRRWFTSDELAPFCLIGRRLWCAYREARRAAIYSSTTGAVKPIQCPNEHRGGGRGRSRLVC